jgi:hypothetical protein
VTGDLRLLPRLAETSVMCYCQIEYVGTVYCREIFNLVGGVTCDPPAEIYHSVGPRVTCDISQNSADSEFFHVNFIHST